ncbi:MAG: hypothetical protein Q7K21_06355 [Elusimicrobiota bacterium]|nr:hypothetical protein [Elusimicrobiota bacterium]
MNLFCFIDGVNLALHEGGWLYNSKDGRVYVNCTHTDSRGQTISSW